MDGIEKLHPEVEKMAEEFLSRCQTEGLKVRITSTFRTEKEQEALYAQGRTTPGAIVTNAKYPLSAHCWGLAFDFCRNIKGREYDDHDGFFTKVGAVGKKVGLFWGGDFRTFPDKPHFEYEKYLPGSSTKKLIEQYGTPEAFIRSWPERDGEEEEEMTQEQFDKMFRQAMDAYLREKGTLPVDGWAEDAWNKAVDKGLLDGTKPRLAVTREQLAVVLDRQTDGAES